MWCNRFLNPAKLGGRILFSHCGKIFYSNFNCFSSGEEMGVEMGPFTHKAPWGQQAKPIRNGACHRFSALETVSLPPTTKRILTNAGFGFGLQLAQNMSDVDIIISLFILLNKKSCGDGAIVAATSQSTQTSHKVCFSFLFFYAENVRTDCKSS